MDQIRPSCIAIGIISGTILLSNCSPKYVAVPTVSPAEPRGQVTALPQQNAWTPRSVPESKEYLIEDSSTISISDDSSHTSSVQTTTLYSLAFIAQADSFVLTARVDSTSTRAYPSSEGRKTVISPPQITHATVSSSGQLSALNSEIVTSCKAGIDAMGMRIFELTLSYPKHSIKKGDRWEDTVSAISCRGKTSLQQQIIREYELLELTKWKEHDVAKIQENVSTVITGNSSDTQNFLSTTGSGMGGTILYVDRDTGLLRESEGHSESKLLVKTSRATYFFTQSVATHIEAQ